MENGQTHLDTAPQIQKSGNLGKLILFLIVIFGFVSAFLGGFFIQKFLNSEQRLAVYPTTGPTSKPVAYPSKSPEVSSNPTQQSSTLFEEGKNYFEDTVILVTKDEPHYSVLATAVRFEEDSGYTQNSRLSFFDGKDWIRKQSSNKTSDSAIYSDSIIKRWNLVIDPSRVLKENIDGDVVADNYNLSFSTGQLQNEISMRSLPGYTKLMSKGEGTLVIDGKSYSAYVLRTKIFSLNSADIQFYGDQLKLTTDWIAFWDMDGNFYHIDTTSVNKPTPIYQTHTIGVFEDSAATVAKTFQVNVTRDGSTPPKTYTITMSNPINQTLNLTMLNSHDKYPNSGYKWYLGQVKGSVSVEGKQISGIGIAEYINQ